MGLQTLPYTYLDFSEDNYFRVVFLPDDTISVQRRGYKKLKIFSHYFLARQYIMKSSSQTHESIDWRGVYDIGIFFSQYVRGILRTEPSMEFWELK